MKKETTIDWIKREMEKFGERSHLLLDWESFDIIIEDAREMEKEQIIRFAISCHQNILRDRNAPENLISENLLLFEQYYNETFGKE